MKHRDPCRGRGPCGETDTLCVRWDFFVLNGVWLSVSLADIDSALEECSVLDADAGGSDVAGQGALGADVNAIGGGNVALQLAQYDDFAGADAGADHAILAYGHAIAGDIDAALDLAINK